MKSRRLFPKVPYVLQKGRHGEVTSADPPYSRYELSLIQKALLTCRETAECPRCQDRFALVRRSRFGHSGREAWLADCQKCRRHAVIPVHRDPEPVAPAFSKLPCSNPARSTPAQRLSRAAVGALVASLMFGAVANGVVKPVPLPVATFDTAYVVFAPERVDIIPEVEQVALGGVVNRPVVVPDIAPVEIPPVDIQVGSPNPVPSLSPAGLTRSSFAGLVDTGQLDRTEPYDLRTLDVVPELVAAGTLRYPHDLKMWGVEGSVVLEFVLDSTGVVEPNSIRVVHSDHEGFNRSAVEAIKRSVYRPGRVRGTPVRVSVTLTLQFQISAGGDR